MTTQLYNTGTYGTNSYGGIGVIPSTYDECLDLIAAAPYVSTKLRYIGLLPVIRGNNNPSYTKGLNTIASETNAIVISALTSEIYTFVKALTTEEMNAFNYFDSDYVSPNPGIVGNAYSSYIGTYYSDDGEPT
jgi:hypothetical protein